MTQSSLAVEPEDLAIVQLLLARHLPPGTRVWAYGSRAKGRGVWRGSDLDLMIDAGFPLEFSLLGMLSEDLSESLVPFVVDLHDWHDTSPAFLERIRPDMVALTLPSGLSVSDT